MRYSRRYLVTCRDLRFYLLSAKICSAGRVGLRNEYLLWHSTMFFWLCSLSGRKGDSICRSIVYILGVTIGKFFIETLLSPVLITGVSLLITIFCSPGSFKPKSPTIALGSGLGYCKPWMILAYEFINFWFRGNGSGSPGFSIIRLGVMNSNYLF